MAATLRPIGDYRDRSAIWRVIDQGGNVVWQETFTKLDGTVCPVRLYQGVKPADRAERRENAEARGLEAGAGSIVQTKRVGNKGGVWVNHAEVV